MTSREVHVWTNRPLGYWPQGIPRPAAAAADAPTPAWNNTGVERRLAAAMAGNYPVPDTLSWDLFLGVAPDVQYHPIYHPFNWRGWVDWGQGALGDMGAHLIDHPVWGSKLGLPTTIETISTPFNKRLLPERDDDVLRVRGARRDAGRQAHVVRRRSDAAEAGRDGRRRAAEGEGGVLYIGTKGKMLQNTYGADRACCRWIGTTRTARARRQLARVPHQAHEMNWVNAIRGKDRSRPRSRTRRT